MQLKTSDTLDRVEATVDKIVDLNVLFSERKITAEDYLIQLGNLLTTHDHSLHSSLVAAVEGKRKLVSELEILPEDGYNQALDDTLTIINSIFKE